MPESKKRVVVIGGGLAGLRIAKQLRKDANVTLVSSRDTFVFFPRLTELLGGTLSAEQCLIPLRSAWSGELIIEKANLVNPSERHVVLDSGKTLSYDVLVVASGSTANFFGTPGSQYSYPFYSADDMQRLREQIMIMLDGDEQKGTHTFAVVGGGPTGVEVAYALAQITRPKRPGSKILLLEGGDTILKPFPEKLRKAVREKLVQAGVEMVTGAAVTEITPMSLSIKRGDGSKETVPCYTTVWAAGSKVNTVQIDGVEYTPKGEIPVRPTMQTQVDSSIFAVGDCAASGAPKTAQAALQQADVVAGNVRAVLRGGKLQPFTYKDKGTMISMGKDTVASVYGNIVTGFVARQLRDKYYMMRMREYK